MQTFRAKAAVSAEKVRGGYYTPQPVARFLAAWVAEAGGRVLEPSCGDGNILRELVSVASDVHGVELDEEEAEKARSYAPVSGQSLFDWLNAEQYGEWDGVAGNPPYIRFGNWPPEQRAPALHLMAAAGLSPSKLTNAWVPFVVASTLAAREGGRVGLVIPAELLQVTYASQLRDYLLGAYREVTLVTFERLLFDGVLQEVVLFLGVKGRGPAQMKTVHLADATCLRNLSLDVPAAPTLLHDHEKWTKYFLAPEQIEVLRHSRDSTELKPLATYAEVNVGVVTGRNSFFTFSDRQVDELGLRPWVRPLVSRGVQLSGIVYDDNCRDRDLAGDLRTWILDAPADPVDAGKLVSYIAAGEREQVHLGYKCSIRKPWWTTPSMWVPDAFMLRQIHLAPRMTVNTARSVSTDTVHRVKIRTEVDPTLLAVAFNNSATFAFAEVMGRSYGGGILELEPREATRLPVPPPSLVTPGLALDVDTLLKSGEQDKALDLVDQQVLVDGLGWSSDRAASLRDAWVALRNRRTRRAR